MVDRLGWTLVYFVWEGAAVAAGLALALLAAGRGRAALRHGLALSALILLAALPLATFVLLAPAPVTVSSGTFRATRGEAIEAGISTSSGAKMPVLVGVWAIGVAVLSLRLAGGMFQLERWRRRDARPAPPEDQARLDALGRRLGLRRRVALFLSERIEVPSAWGVFRPVVVLPASLMTGLAPTQIEGVLLHELAHVRRHDYLVNLVQGVVETALFYHPAVWWVSSVVRRERERLCDDAAVAALGDPMPYARALLHLEERRQMPRPALSAREGDLMNRIARVLAPKPAPTRLSPLAPGLVALAVAGLALGGVLRAEAQTSKPVVKKPSPDGRSGLRQAWHRPGLDVTVDAIGDAFRIAARGKEASVVGYYRVGDGNRTWHRPGLDVTVYPSATDSTSFRIDARSAQSNVAALYRVERSPALTSRKQAARSKKGMAVEIDPQAELDAAVAGLSAERANLARAKVRTQPQGKDVARALNEVGTQLRTLKEQEVSIRDQIAQAATQVAAAQSQAAREKVRLDSRRPHGATYGAPGKGQNPVWSQRDFPQGVGVLVAPEGSADANAQDWAAMQKAQTELAQGLTAQRRAILRAQGDAARARVKAEVDLARALATDPQRRADLTAAAHSAQASAERARADAARNRKALLNGWTIDQARLQAALSATRSAEVQKAMAAQRATFGRPDAESLKELNKALKEQGLFRRDATAGTLPILKIGQGTTGADPFTRTFSSFPALQPGKPLTSSDVFGRSIFGESKVDLGEYGRVSIDAKDAAFGTVLRALARKAKLSVVIARGSYADVSLVLSDRSVTDALAILCKAANAEWRSENGVYYVAPRKDKDAAGASNAGR